MDGTGITLMVVLGIALRIGIPLVATIVLALALKNLDEHWQAEARNLPVVTVDANAGNPGCWDIKGCSQEMKQNCVAFAHPETPCWQVFRTDDGRMQEKCAGCEIFRQAPVPVKVPVRVRA